MKRQAERQLAKDDDEEDFNEDPSQGFKKADDTALAARVIRGLPKRGGAARVPENAPTTTPTPIAFSMPTSSGSSPFSTSTNTANATSSLFSGFSFKQTTEATEKVSAAPSSIFGANSSSSTFTATPSQPSSIFAPSSNPFSNPPPTATNTSKAFASILSGSGVSSPFGAPPTAKPASQPTFTSNNDKFSNNSVPEKYYTNLRGLNTSVLSTISKTVESDPFVDISDLLEQYKTFRLKIQKEFDESSSSGDAKSTLSSNAPAESSKPAMPTMPTPPSSFAGFTTTTPAPSSGGNTKINLFDFKGTSSTGALNPFAAAKEAPAPPSVFGGSSFSPPAAASTAASPAPPSFFTFGASSDKASTNLSPFGTFGNSAPSAFNTGSSSTSSAPKSVFGSSSTTTNSPFGGFGSSADDKPASSSVFGNADKTPSATPSLFGKTSTTTSEAQKTTSSYGFGSYSAGSGSAFGGGKPSEATAETEKPASDENGSQDNADNLMSTNTAQGGTDPSVAGLINTSNPHDEDGEGEENEETTHSSRSKAFKLTTDTEGGMKWVGIGSGLLKLKKDKNTGARRVLLRNSTNGKVIMNFILYAGLKPTQTKSSVSFIGHDAGASQTYTVRMSNEADAQELKGALEREIAFVKAKEP